MKELKPRIYDGKNGIEYVLVGDYYLPDIRLPEDVEDDDRPVGKWGAMHREYLMSENAILYNQLVLTGKLHGYLADLNEQAGERFKVIMKQMMEAEGVTEELKRKDQWAWIRRTNSIVSRAEEVIKSEMVYV